MPNVVAATEHDAEAVLEDLDNAEALAALAAPLAQAIAPARRARPTPHEGPNLPTGSIEPPFGAARPP